MPWLRLQILKETFLDYVKSQKNNEMTDQVAVAFEA